MISTTRSCCSIEFIESCLLRLILVTYKIGIYICIYIYKVRYIHSFLLSSTYFEIWKNIFVKLISRLLHSTISQVMWYFWVFIVNPFSPLWSIFFSRKLCFFRSPCLLLIAESISLDTSGKPTMGFFLKTISPSWIVLSISLDEVNSVEWLLKSWWQIIFFLLL